MNARFIGYFVCFFLMLCACSEDVASLNSDDMALGDSLSSAMLSSSTERVHGSSSSKRASSSSISDLSSSSWIESSSSFTLLAKDVPWNPNVVYGQLKDTRDGRIYKTVLLADREWMAENLEFDTLDHIGSWRLDQHNYTTFGRLYNHPTAKTACPAGWSLPKQAEWESLLAYYEISKWESNVLAARLGWEGSNDDWDELGFRALPSGSIFLNTFSDSGLKAYWWSSDSGTPFIIYSYQDMVNWSLSAISNSENGYSVRCIKQL